MAWRVELPIRLQKMIALKNSSLDPLARPPARSLSSTVAPPFNFHGNEPSRTVVGRSVGPSVRRRSGRIRVAAFSAKRLHKMHLFLDEVDGRTDGRTRTATRTTRPRPTLNKWPALSFTFGAAAAAAAKGSNTKKIVRYNTKC